ncbi:hypothetical protein QMT40_002936 [Parvibaculaceae bacterium PLY_AMNH_Bact1]|nr:hypothetical protein QMT40_002936 [Parvibaculaceae bacterium PLY_AMNH_Bact1]
MKQTWQPLASGLLFFVSCMAPVVAEEPSNDWPFDRNPPREQSWPFNRDQTTGSEGMRPVAEPGDPVLEVPADWDAAIDTPSSEIPTAPQVQTGPIRILPPGVGDASGAPSDFEAPANDPVSLFPAGPSAGGRGDLPTRAVGARPGEAGTGIEVGALGKVDEASVGLLDDRNGGLGTAMWSGTDRRVVEQLIAQVPGPTNSPTLGALSRRLLLTSARPPQGTSSGPSLLALRLQRLNGAGRSDDIARLYARAGVSQPSPAAAMEFALATLATGDRDAACNLLGGLPVGGDPGTDLVAGFALKLSIFCQISGGMTAAANLTVDLAREQGLDAPYFLSLAAAATDGLSLDAAEPRLLDPLIYRMMGLAGRVLPGDVVGRLVPSLLVPVAEDSALDPEVRIAAAERAAALGLIDGDQMAAAYLAVSYTREDVAGVRVGVEPASPYRRRALFHQAVLDERVPAGRADLLAMLFFRERGGDAYAATLAAHRGSLASVPPSNVLTSFAPLAVRAFIEQGDRVRAGMWLSVVEGAALDTSQVRELAAVLRLIDPNTVAGAPLPPLVDADAEVAPSISIPAFLQPALNDLAAGGAAREFAALEIVLLDALGLQLPASVWDAVLVSGGLPGGEVAPVAVSQRLKLASSQKRVGETVLLTLAALSDGGVGQAHPQTLSETVKALRIVGLEQEARRLAAEALMARIGDRT